MHHEETYRTSKWHCQEKGQVELSQTKILPSKRSKAQNGAEVHQSLLHALALYRQAEINACLSHS